MSRVIFKFQLTATDISMSKDAEVCTFEYQNGVPCIWAIVDPDAPKEVRRFKIFGTGHPLPEAGECRYVGTVFSGPYVWHLVEILL